MKAFAILLNVSAPSVKPGGKTQASQPQDDNAFAPTLSKAVENRKNSSQSNTHTATAKTRSSKNTDTRAEKSRTEPDHSQSDKAVNDKNIANEVSSRSQEVTTDKKTAQKTEANEKISEERQSQDTTKTAPKASSLDEFLTALLGYLFNLPQDISTSDLQEKAKTFSEKFGIGKQESYNLLSSLTSLSEDGSSPNQILEKILQNPEQNATLQKILQSLLGKEALDQPDSGKLSFNLELVQTGGAESGTSSMSSSIDFTNPDTTEKMSQILQRLQEAMAGNNGQQPLTIKLHSQSHTQNQPLGLHSFSPSLLNYTDKDVETAQTDIYTAPLQTETIKGKIVDPGKSQEHRLLQSDELHNQSILVKADENSLKDSDKAEGKDAQLQNTDHQAPLLTGRSETNSLGSTVQQLSFGSTLSQTLQQTLHTPNTTPQAHFLPWTTAQENALINQVTQRFHFNINSSTKMSLKLYPEELGELKIDVQMKDGAVKANILTQTQQVQQVLEKYIPKLRTFMEQQGLTVDDILVTNTSESVGEHELFQQDFVNNHDFSPPGRPFKNSNLSDTTFETTFPDTVAVSSGVNVTV